MRDYLGRLLEPFIPFNHDAAVKALRKAEAALAAVDGPLKAEEELQIARRKEYLAIIDGTFIRHAQKIRHREIAPLRERVAEQRRKLQQHPRPLIAAYLAECSAQKSEVQAELFKAPTVTLLNSLGEFAERTFIDRDSAQACLDEIARRMTAAADLAVLGLSDEELKAKIEALRAQSLPEVRRKKQFRENEPDSEIQESFVA